MKTIEFERKAILAMYGNETDIILEVCNEYVSNYAVMVEGLNKAFETSADELAREIHFHKSAFKFIGFSQLISECTDLENAIKTNNRANLKYQFNQFLDLIEQTKPILEREMMSLREGKNDSRA